MIKGLLFDFDGTLTLPGAIDFPAIKQELGCPSDHPILEYLHALPSQKSADLFKILEKREKQAADASEPNIGAEKCLLTLKRKGFLLGILTRNSLCSVKVALRKFRQVTIGDFAVVITRENSLPKPNPDGVFRAAREMGISTSELLVVGDLRFDVLAARAAGACSVLLTNGAASSMKSGDPVPDYTVGRLEELLEIAQLCPCSRTTVP
jgi:hydrogenase expression/formation protein HypE